MTLKNYLIVMSFLTIICLVVLGLMINLIDPSSTNWLGFSLFYLALFLSLSGALALFGFFIRFVVLKKTLAFYAVATAFRQSFLFALFISISLFLLSINLLTWLNVSLLLIVFSILELFIASYRKNKTQ